MIQNQYFKSINSFENYLETINYKYLNIISINLRSISSLNKFNKFKSFLTNLPRLPDILAIQETWFEEKCSEMYKIPHYNSIHCCRSDGYGGTSIYISNKYQFTVNCCQSLNFVDIIQVTLHNIKVNGKQLEFMSYYRSQKCKVEDFLNILENQLVNFGNNPSVFVGDSNVDLIESNQPENLTSLFQCFNLESCHFLVTRPQSGTCIDHVFSNIADQVAIDSVECSLTDHNLVCCKLKFEMEHHNFETVKTTCDYAKVKNYLEQNLFNINCSQNPSDSTSNLVRVINEAILRYTTESREKICIKRDIAPWINKNLWSLMELKKKLLKKRKNNLCDPAINENLKRISKVIRKATRESMNDYYQNNILNCGGDIRKCWRFLNEVTGRKQNKIINVVDSNGLNIDDNKIKATLLNDYFINIVDSLRENIDKYQNDNCNSLRTLTQHNKRFSLKTVTSAEVENITMHLNKSNSTGNDNISSKLLTFCCQIVSSHLAEIFNSMIRTSIYPEALKLHKVIPIPKDAHANTVDKYRPIALLSVIDKVFEKIIHLQLSEFLEKESLLHKNQFGFVKGSGTDEAVVSVVNTICEGLDKGNSGVAGIFYDFSKAFDLVDHTILIEKLIYYGIVGPELKLIESFLTNRKQYVEILGEKSTTAPVNCGVPQGSVLGPLLFMLYLNDINNIGLFGKIIMFADDVSIFYPYKFDLVLKTQMERDSALLFEFARLNRLVLNADKTKLLRFRPHSQVLNNNFGIYVDGKLISEEHEIKYLGIILKSSLSWDAHMIYLKSKVASASGMLFKLKSKLNVKTKMLIYQSLIHSRLEYLAIIYAFKNTNELKSLQSVQNKALKCVFNLNLRHNTVSLFKDYCKTVLPIHGLYEKQILFYVFKSINNIGHRSVKLNINQSRFNTRNAGNLRTARCRLEATKQRIDYLGSLMYNNLTENLKSCNQLSVFKINVKKYLLERIEMLLE